MDIIKSAIEELSEKFKYKKLPKGISSVIQMILRQNLNGLQIDGSTAILCSRHSNPICNGYTRVVVGDYGAYVEFSEVQKASNFIIAKGQEYRETDKYSHCKYSWLNISHHDDTKIYKQKHTVDYADYKVGMYYVSVFDVTPKAPK